MRCSKCQAPLDSSTRKLCVGCIGDAIKATGEHTHMQAVHQAKLNQKQYQERVDRKAGRTWWK